MSIDGGVGAAELSAENGTLGSFIYLSNKIPSVIYGKDSRRQLTYLVNLIHY